MSLVKEGTTAAGFKCDSKGCTNKATHTPVICIPAVGYPNELADRLFVVSHICMEHRLEARKNDYVGPKMRRVATARAAGKGQKPDFDRWFIQWWPCVSSEYQRFLDAAGLVEPGDAQVAGEIILPGGEEPIH